MITQFWTFFLVTITVCIQLRAASNLKIDSWIDFQCPEAKRTGQLVYAKSVRTNVKSSHHFIWSTIGGFPAFFIVNTNSSENVTIDWDKLLRNEKRSVFFDSEDVQNSIGVLFSKMYFWEANPDDFQSINDTLVHPINFSNFPWDSVENHWSHNDESCQAQFTLKKNHTINNGSITFKLKVINSGQRYEDLPHLWFNEKSIHIQTIVDKMQYDAKNIRIGFELMLFASGSSNHNKTYSSIDDEFSPGIFHTFNLFFEDTYNSKKSSFLQWKPVIYSTPDMIISKMLQTQAHGPLKNQTKIPVDNYPVHGFLSGLKSDSFSMFRFNVTFGAKDEEFYTQTNYTNWSFTVGLGDTHVDEMSVSIKLIIIICFGVPAFAFLLLPVFIIVQKCRKKRSLLLNEEENE